VGVSTTRDDRIAVSDGRVGARVAVAWLGTDAVWRAWDRGGEERDAGFKAGVRRWVAVAVATGAATWFPPDECPRPNADARSQPIPVIKSSNTTTKSVNGIYERTGGRFLGLRSGEPNSLSMPV
jgi:hypothetical protein